MSNFTRPLEQSMLPSRMSGRKEEDSSVKTSLIASFPSLGKQSGHEMTTVPPRFRSGRDRHAILPFQLRGDGRREQSILPPLNIITEADREQLDARYRVGGPNVSADPGNVEGNSRMNNDSNIPLGKAAHKELLDDYANLVKRCNDLEAENAQLRGGDRVAESVEVRATGTSGASTASVPARNNVVALAPSLPRLEGPKREDYPKILFWTRHQFSVAQNARMKKNKSQQGKDDPKKFIQYANGEFINEEDATVIREFIRSVFKDLKESNTLRFKSRWSELGNAEKKYICERVYEEYPFFRLCANDWKCHLLASRTLNSHTNTKRRPHRRALNATNVQAVEPTFQPVESPAPDIAESQPLSPVTRSPIITGSSVPVEGSPSSSPRHIHCNRGQHIRNVTSRASSLVLYYASDNGSRARSVSPTNRASPPTPGLQQTITRGLESIKNMHIPFLSKLTNPR